MLSCLFAFPPKTVAFLDREDYRACKKIVGQLQICFVLVLSGSASTTFKKQSESVFIAQLLSVHTCLSAWSQISRSFLFKGFE
jgi:hypothetical protein